MKVFSASLALAACLPLVLARHKGFNVAANNPDGSCKSEADWEKSFREMKKIPGGFNEVRVYASSDCSTLQNAVPAAKRTGVKLLAGVWSTPPEHYQAERQALSDACNQHGTGWLSSVSVGSEDLYRGDISPSDLAGQVRDIRKLVSSFKGGRDVPIGHVDTYTTWIKDNATPLIHAVDFIGMDAYPYYQGVTIGHSKKTFHKSLDVTQRAAKRAGRPGLPVWITETAWPSHGPKFEKSIPSVKNAARYWHQTMCGLFKKHSVFVFVLRDDNHAAGDPKFGVLNGHWKPVFNLAC